MNVPELYRVFQKHPRISTDTRSDVGGSLFFALRGSRFNGNDFAREAIKKGAAFAVVDEGDYPGGSGFIRVDDCLMTLQQLSQYHRARLKATLIAITGSNGKTTTKELVREVLSEKYRVFATEGNLNNHIGVPLSLLRIREDVQFGIIEMGANHLGEIELLCEIARPEYGIITNIGRAHIEGFGSVEGVKKAKGELYGYLSGNKGGIFINADNAILIRMAEGFEGRITWYGNRPDALCNSSIAGLHPYLSFSMTFLADPEKDYNGTSRLVGSYNMENILAAACIGSYFGVTSEKILEALVEYEPGMLRSQLVETGKNILVVDAYNANPSSMEQAILDFEADPHPDKVLMLGEMKELGDSELSEHEKLIQWITGKSFRQVILIGNLFSAHTIPAGYLTFKSTAECINWLKGHSITNAKILLKGSRLLKLEELIGYL